MFIKVIVSSMFNVWVVELFINYRKDRDMGILNWWIVIKIWIIKVGDFFLVYLESCWVCGRVI